MKIRIFFGLIILVVTVAGCKSSGPAISQISGHYSGNLINQVGVDFQKTGVLSSIPSTEGHSKAFSVTSATGQILLQLELTNLTDSGLTLKLNPSLPADADLQLDTPSGCYTKTTPQNITLCASEPEITLTLDAGDGGVKMSLVLYSDPTPQPSETPQSFSLSEAISRAQKMSFQSKIEFEHVIQARATARAAYLHLVPQLTLSTLAGNIEPGISSLIGAIGDLAPFLLPSRWFQMKEAANLSQAEQDSERLMRLDMAAQVEGLFYAYDRDRKSKLVYQSFETQVAAILSTAVQSEAAGILTPGSADAVQAAYNDLTHNDGVYDQILTEDRSALSQALGFFNPLAVEDALIDNEDRPVEGAQPLDFSGVNAQALARSVEVDQLRDFICDGKLAKKEEYFDWLDPAANPQLGLGLALPSQLKIAQSQVNELEIVQDQTRSGISQAALDAVTDYNQAVDNFQDAQSDAALHERRLAVLLAQLGAKTALDAFDLCSVIADNLGAHLQMEQSRANYRVARAEVDRLLLEGYYQGF